VYRVVLDTNVFVSGIAIAPTPPSQVIDLWRRGEYLLITSPQLLEEVADVLSRPEIMRFTGLSIDETHGFIKEIKLRADVTTGDYEVEAITVDPDDNMVLAAALEGQATHIVTGDTKSLLPLKEYHGIQILQPRDFLTLFHK
jgi:putative PIN family toxin of toxin-antitoxin system